MLNLRSSRFVVMAINDITSSSNTFLRSSSAIERSSERIASGLRINSAADDAAGLAQVNRFDSQINEFNQSVRNANDGISLLQTAAGGLSSITESLQRLRELSLQSANGTLAASDRQFLDKEAQQLKLEISRTVESTTFNQQSLYANNEPVNIQLGAGEADTVDVGVDNVAAILDDLNFADVDLSTAEGASSALGTIDQLQEQIDSSAADIGAQTNRLDSSISNLFTREENAAASRSRIADADYAKEISQLTADTLRQQVGIALQTQSNANRSDVLRLLSGS